MAVILAGVSHATAPIEIREKLAFRPQEAVQVLAHLRDVGLIREGVVLSTCNRTEVYAVEQNGDSIARITEILSARHSCHASLTWPCICDSPSIMDSSPAATAKRWEATSRSRRM